MRTVRYNRCGALCTRQTILRTSALSLAHGCWFVRRISTVSNKETHSKERAFFKSVSKKEGAEGAQPANKLISPLPEIKQRLAPNGGGG
jgi:hypothetical protein